MTETAYTRWNTLLLPQAWLLIGLIALADWKVDDRVPLGWLYLLPIAILASRLSRPGIAGVAVLCTALAESFDGFRWQWSSGLSREVLYFSSFAGIGLFVHQTLLGRRAATTHMQALEAEIHARREAEEQLEVLIESTPVAVFTVDAAGTILLANAAAEHLLAAAPGALPSRSVSEFLPALLDVPALRDAAEPSFRTMMQCRGHRATGEIFEAHVWFSTYRTSTGPRLAALVVDTSDELRDREESSLDQLLAGSRILVGAVSHEVRNVCAAIKVVYENLARAEARTFAGTGASTEACTETLREPPNGPGSLGLREDARHGPQPHSTLTALGGNGSSANGSSGNDCNGSGGDGGNASNGRDAHLPGFLSPSLNKDFEALGTLVVALERIASMELSQAANQLSYIDLNSLLEEVLIVIAPALREQEIALVWQVEASLPAVWADRQSLMQVFLNLVKNSERAMEASLERTLTLTTSHRTGPSLARVSIRVRDTGTGVEHPELLFKPFQQQASATGLGLYLSRALMRSFSGELRYEAPSREQAALTTATVSASPAGACFIVEVNSAPSGSL